MSIVEAVFSEGAVLTDALGLGFGFPKQVVKALAKAGDVRSLPMVNAVDDFHFTHGRPNPMAAMMGLVEVNEGSADVYEMTELFKDVDGAPERTFVYLTPVEVEGESYIAMSFGKEERPDPEASWAATYWTSELLAKFGEELTGLDYENAPSQSEAE